MSMRKASSFRSSSLRSPLPLRQRVAMLVGVAALAAAPLASADEPELEATPPAVTPPAVRPGRWYGWQTLLADGATIGLTALAVSWTPTESATGYVFLGGYLAGAPVVHLAHGNPSSALYSLLLRLAVPGALGLTGLGVGLATMGSGDWAGLWPIFTMAAGVMSGMVAASVIDAAAFAREQPGIRARDVGKATKLRVVPSFAVTSHQASAGVVGVF